MIVDRSDDFTTDRPGDGSDGTSTSDGGDTGGSPDGGVPVAVAVLVTPPASMSAWVTTYSAVQVTSSPGASEDTAGGHSTTGGVPVPVKEASVTSMSVRVTLPVFATTNV